MNQLGLISITASLMSSLFCACSDDSVPNASVVPALSDVSSSSLVNSSSDVAYSEADNPVSSSSLAVSSSSIDMSSSSSDESLSSSAVADSPTFSKYLAQFVSPGENSLNFDSHVVAFNADALSLKCEENMVSYVGEEERLVPFKPISEENIAECFPKTASLLKNKFSPDVKFYAIVVELGADPLFAVLNKFTADEIVFYGVHPGGENCILSASMTRTIFLVADSDEFVKNGNIPVSGQKFHSDIWKCDESGRNIPSVRNFGEWYSDSLL